METMADTILMTLSVAIHWTLFLAGCVHFGKLAKGKGGQ